MSDHKPVRVMHFIHSLKAGGAEQQLAYLLDHSDSEEITQAVCCFNDDGVEDLGSRLDIFKLGRKNRLDFKFQEIYKLLSAWNPDIVHNWLPNVLVNSYFPARWYGKAIYTASYRSAVRVTSLHRVFQALVYLLSDALVSNLAADSLFFPFRQIFNIKNGSFIPNGIPIKKIAAAGPALPPGIQTGPDDIFLLFVGRLSPEKNLPLLLQGTQRLSGEYRGLKLIICGDGRSKDRLLKQTRDLAIDDRVFFLGYREDIYPIMKACDLLVLPSFREGMSNVLFEALAAGLPVIASKIPAHEYWFQDKDIVSLFDPYSLDDICECIRCELNRPEDEIKVRREEAERLVSGLDVDEMVRKYTDFYLRLYQRYREIS